MRNQNLSKIFKEMSQFLEMEGVAFKPFAYNKAASSLMSMDKDVLEIYQMGGVKALKDIPGVGDSIADHIEEYLKTGKIKTYEKLKKKLPLKIDELTKVEGMGTKKAKILYQKLGIKNLKDLERAAKSNKIAKLDGFGEKTEKNIIQGLEFLKRDKGRFPLNEILPTARRILSKLREFKEVDQISLAGSVRRGKDTIGDVDILVTSKNPNLVMDFFVKIDGIEKVWAKGDTKASVRMQEGFDVDLRVVPEKSYGSALQYFTGNRDHNIITRRIAIEKGLKLSEYGIFKGKKQIAGDNEEDVYKTIGLSYIAPELRENNGEINAALKGELPDLIENRDIKGDLHCHTVISDGENSIGEMVESAMAMGYEYIGISDHAQFLGIAHGIDEIKILKQNKDIEEINKKFKNNKINFRVLHGCEVNILADGSLDIKDEILEKLDYAIGSIHSHMKMNKKEMTDRIIKAMENKNIDIIGHPTGRIVGKRDEYEIDFDKILETAKKTGTILEINSSSRLDLNSFYIRRAKEAGVKMIINTDSHNREQFKFIEYGILQARRGWAEKKDIINTNSVEKLLEYFK